MTTEDTAPVGTSNLHVQQAQVPKTALTHYWLVNMRGGEKVVEQLRALYPAADLFTHVFDEGAVSSFLRQNVRTTFISRLPWAKRLYKYYLPFMPIALERLDLSGYELVISSEAGPAKGGLPSPNTLHICYCHSPMRYVWRLGNDRRATDGYIGILAEPIFHYLRQWDLATAFRVDHFIANSENTRRRIGSLYRRDAEVIHPPVATDRFEIDPAPRDFYLFVGELVEYKRADLAVDTCRELDLPLVVIGEGPHRERLQRRAGPATTFLGKQDDDTVACYMRQCRALIFPGEEDFGIVPVEVMASERPVVALGKGGALETVVPNRTGILFSSPTVGDLIAALRRMETCHQAFVPTHLRAHATGFDTSVFRTRMQNFIDKAIEQFRADVPPRSACSGLVENVTPSLE